MRLLFYLTAEHVTDERAAAREAHYEQMSLFESLGGADTKKEKDEQALEKEKKLQQAMLDIKKKFGKNAVLKGVSLEEGATARERNRQIGGHKA